MSLSSSSMKRFAFLAAALAPVALVTGCANMVGTASDAGSVTPAATITGALHGGNQPIGGATIQLYSPGTGSYGAQGTLLATTSSATDGSASFSFSQLPTDTVNFPTGVHNSTGSSYSCPTGNPLIYLSSTGGATTGSSLNTDATFIVALGRCDQVGSLFVNVNEVDTVGTIAALQQYFDPGTHSFGYPNTPQAQTGFYNAVATVANLVNISNGTANPTVTPASAVPGVTMTGTPESAKINTIANILAACINTASNPIATSADCQTLFNNAVPPASAYQATTSQPSKTFLKASDTAQAAYYMLVNPTNSQDPAGKTHNLYVLSSPTAPFQPTISAQPLDWTIGITWTPSGTCTNANAAAFLGSAESIAVDAQGNVWVNNGATAATNALAEISSTGAPSACAFGDIPAGRGLTIDTAGNVWTTGNNTTSSVYEYLAGGTTLTWPTSTGAGGVAADGSGNVFYSPYSSATAFQEYIGAASATTTSAATTVGTSVASSTGLVYMAADPSGRVWTPTTSSAGFYDLYPGGTTPVGGYTLVNVGTAITTAVLNNDYGSAIDSSGNIFGGNTCCASAVSNTFYKITPTTDGAATGTNSAKNIGGLVAPRSSAVDGAGNVWAGMGYPVINSVSAAVGPPAVAAAPAVYALAEVDNSLTLPLSPSGVGTPGTCATTPDCQTKGGFQKASLGTVRGLAIDPSGNVWAASNGTTQAIVEIVGQAVPVVTPLAVGAKNSTLGTKP